LKSVALNNTNNNNKMSSDTVSVTGLAKIDYKPPGAKKCDVKRTCVIKSEKNILLKILSSKTLMMTIIQKDFCQCLK